MADSAGMVDLRRENVERLVDGFALEEYKLKQRVKVSGSNADKETYHQRTAGDLSASASRNVKGVGRLSELPYAEQTYTEVNAYHQKYGLKTIISWEDARTNDIDLISEHLRDIARGIAQAEDDNIWDVMSESQSPTNINSVTISSGNEWNSATVGNRDPIQNILNAKKEIWLDNYDPDNGGELWLSPTDYANLLGNANVVNAGQFWTDDPTRKGTVGMICGLKVIVANSITNDYAMVVIPKTAMTYKQVQPMRVKVTENFGVSFVVEAFSYGVPQLRNPQAVCIITNTQA